MHERKDGARTVACDVAARGEECVFFAGAVYRELVSPQGAIST